MLNPSVGDETFDDKTIKRLIFFTKKFGYGGFYVGNIFPNINTKVKDLYLDLSHDKKKNRKHVNSMIDKSESVENVIFITDDAKDDWWYKISSNGKKTIGPLAELQSEIYRKSNIRNFHMYSTSMFLEDGKSNLAVDVSESSIEDASTPHVSERSNNLTSNQLSEMADKYRTSTFNNEELRELVERANKISSFKNENMRVIAERANKLASLDSDRMREILESANRVSSFDRDRINELAERANTISSFDTEKLRKIIESQRRIQEEDYEVFSKINRYVRKDDEDDES